MKTIKWIPTASNKQKLKWIVIESPDKVQELSRLTIEWIKENNISKEILEQWEKGEDLILRKAPHLIIALGKKDYFWSGAEAGIALTYLELFAHANKLGTCWAGYLQISLYCKKGGIILFFEAVFLLKAFPL